MTTATRPNQLWLTDFTEHPTGEGKIYCCAVLDLYSRKVVGWAIDRRCEAALVLEAIDKAGGSKATSPSTVIHSDHGTQFTSWAFTEDIRRLGLLSSMGTVGDCCDCTHGVLLGLDADRAVGPPEVADQSRAGHRHGRLHRALLQFEPQTQLAWLSHPERVRGLTLNHHPVGHIVVKSGPLNGVKPTESG